jgi:hypothetical protein
MTDRQQRATSVLINQVTKDTISNLLGILDGVSLLDGFRGHFQLTYESGHVLNGDLQDIFLADEH